MQGSEQNVWKVSRCIQHAVLLLLLGSILPGCLPGVPGIGWGEDDADATAPGNSQAAPVLNRNYKSNFLSLQVPSVSSVQATLMPDIGPGFLGAFSTVENRKPGAATAPNQFATATEMVPGFEPAIQPPAKSLANFYAALSALASGRRAQPVSILHLGDDHIAYDRFAGALREHLTARFGSAGRGLMMPGLYPIRGMKADRGGKWNVASAAAGAQGPFGITGVSITSASGDAWLRFTAAQGTFDWAEVTFMTGPGSGTALVGLDSDIKAVPTQGVKANETSIRFSAKAREVLIKPRGDGPVTVLSVATGTNTPGIAYSNLGLPGATAWTPEKWSPSLVVNDLRKLNPDLIMIEYGTREGFDDGLDAKQYEEHLTALAGIIRQGAPQASMLIVGPPDSARLPSFSGSGGSQVCRALNLQEIAIYDRMTERADERLARWHTPPKLEAVRTAQRRAASSTGAYYWDWAKYMGGPCSIHAWASATPPLAEPDHITLTEAGDGRSARALFAELMAGYDAYQRGMQAKAQAFATTVDAKAVHPAAAPKKRKVQ
jgi:hypothetical protein